jgi:hypothetical protein
MANGTIANTKRVGRHIVPFVTGRTGSRRRAMFSLAKFWSKASVIEEKAASLHVRIGLIALIALFAHFFLRLRD